MVYDYRISLGEPREMLVYWNFRPGLSRGSGW